MLSPHPKQWKEQMVTAGRVADIPQRLLVAAVGGNHHVPTSLHGERSNQCVFFFFTPPGPKQKSGVPSGCPGTPIQKHESVSLGSHPQKPTGSLPVRLLKTKKAAVAWDFLVGMVVLRPMRRVKTPPKVSMPKDRGVTSSRRMSCAVPRLSLGWAPPK